MIKVGDYIKFNNKIDRVEEIVPTPNDKYMIYFENIEHGVLFNDLYDSRVVDYKQLYEQQKQRADELQKQLNEKSEGNKSLLNRIDELTTVIEELHISNSGFCEQTELSKLRADQLEKRWSELRKRMEHDEKEAFGEGDVIAHTVHNYVLELMEDLEEDGE